LSRDVVSQLGDNVETVGRLMIITSIFIHVVLVSKKIKIVGVYIVSVYSCKMSRVKKERVKIQVILSGIIKGDAGEFCKNTQYSDI